jgi:hypothetical protein
MPQEQPAVVDQEAEAAIGSAGNLLELHPGLELGR